MDSGDLNIIINLAATTGRSITYSKIQHSIIWRVAGVSQPANFKHCFCLR